MMTTLLVLLAAMLLTASRAAAQFTSTWGSAGWSTAYEPPNATDGSTATAWEGRCDDALPNTCAHVNGQIAKRRFTLGRSASVDQHITGLTIHWLTAGHISQSTTLQTSTDTAAAIGEGDNLTWTTAGTVPYTVGVVDVSVAVDIPHALHWRLVMTPGPGTPVDGEYPPAITEVVANSTAVSTPPPPPPTAGVRAIGEVCVGCLKMAAIGTSVMNGTGTYGSPPYTSTDSFMMKVMRLRPNIQFANYAVTMLTTLDVLQTQLPPALAWGADAIVYEAGRNDCGYGFAPSVPLGNIRTIINQVLAAGKKFVLLGAVPSGAASAPGVTGFTSCMQTLAAGVEQIARDYPEVTYCPTAWRLHDPASSDPTAPFRHLAPDWTHFTDYGNKIIADEILAPCFQWAPRMPGQ